MKPGTMVRLVWACCANGRKHLGWVGTVQAIAELHEEPCQCRCGYTSYGRHAEVDIDRIGWVPVSWLIQIEPPEEQERDRVEEELTA